MWHSMIANIAATVYFHGLLLHYQEEAACVNKRERRSLRREQKKQRATLPFDERATYDLGRRLYAVMRQYMFSRARNLQRVVPQISDLLIHIERCNPTFLPEFFGIKHSIVNRKEQLRYNCRATTHRPILARHELTDDHREIEDLLREAAAECRLAKTYGEFAHLDYGKYKYFGNYKQHDACTICKEPLFVWRDCTACIKIYITDPEREIFTHCLECRNKKHQKDLLKPSACWSCRGKRISVEITQPRGCRRRLQQLTGAARRACKGEGGLTLEPAQREGTTNE